MKYKLLAIALLLTITSFAQKTFKGKVLDASNNNPLSGATISFAGKGGTTTDKDGSFSVDCDKVKSFTVSFIGYESYKVNIKNCDEEVTVKLEHAAGYLEEVEITAISTNNKNILYQPSSISKLSSVELKRGNGLFLDDAIQTNVTGVIMNRRSVAGGQQFNIRGYGNGTRGTRGASSNFDGQGYKLYLNGIPVTDAEGITTFDDIDFASIGNVEVAKGPAGTLYGLAIAGAVNLSTVKAPKGKTTIGQEVMLGSYGLQRYTTTAAIGRDKSSVLINYGHQKTDGYSWHNSSKKDFVNFIAEFTPNEKQSIMTYAGYSNSYDERIGELTLTQWANDDYSGNVDYIRRNAHSAVRTFRLGVGHTYNFTNNISNNATVFGTGFQSDVSSAGGWTDKNTINYGLRSVFTTKFDLKDGISLSGLTGIETQRQDAEQVGYSMKASPFDTAVNPTASYITVDSYKNGVYPYWVINAATSNVFYNSRTTSLFTQWTLSLPHDLSITAGIGTSNMKIDLNDRFNLPTTTRPNRYQRNYDNMISPTVAINKVISKNVSVYASYSKAYKAPVSSYFFITTPAVTTPATPATGRVNETLKPEEGNQFEIGTKGNLLHDKLNYELAYFNTRYKNKMTAISVVSPANPNTTLYSYVVNGGEQTHNGFEVLVKFTAVQSTKSFFTLVRPFANLTINNFKYDNGFIIYKSVVAQGKEDYSNLNVAGVPKNVANIGLDVVTKPGLYGNITFNHRDKAPIGFIPTTTSTEQPGNYTWATSCNLLNAKIGYRQNLGKHFDIDVYASAQNITGTKYYLMIFANQLPDSYIPGPREANYFGGVNLKYTF
ncbi:MAG: TonB-dependent receptor [Sphingobacteriales bacterium]|nr:TonB-dependent receptor [Sphingobacteriales bacterium]